MYVCHSDVHSGLPYVQAIPGNVLPEFLAGNLGEVLLLASLVTTETVLRVQGM